METEYYQLQRRRRRRRRQPLNLGPLPLLILLVVVGFFLIQGVRSLFFRPAPAPELSEIVEIDKVMDQDGDGVEDYADMVAGVRAYFETDPHYKSVYYAGGYPTDGYGVCTDVIWQAFAAAGYDLKGMIDEDIRLAPEAYPDIEEPDPNIDFRRVFNLHNFFSRHAQSLTCDLNRPEEWEAGDIVIFGNDQHIGLCSDIRNENGIPLLLHHGNPYDDTEESDEIYEKKEVTAHFRWLG